MIETLALKPLSLFAAILSSACIAHADLKFERTLIEEVISLDSQSHPFEFAFENRGESTVEISEISTTCGCTVATLEKMIYEPGESGVIKGGFTKGNRQGVQVKKIYVAYKAPSKASAELTVKLDIPPAVKIKPMLLLWKTGSDVEAKDFVIIPNSSTDMRILSVESKSSIFEVSGFHWDEALGGFKVTIIPLRMKIGGRGLIKISVSVGEDEPRTIFAHALIR